MSPDHSNPIADWRFGDSPELILLRLPVEELYEVVPILQSARVIPKSPSNLSGKRGLQFQVRGTKVTVNPEDGASGYLVTDQQVGWWVSVSVRSTYRTSEGLDVVHAVMQHWPQTVLVLSTFSGWHGDTAPRNVARMFRSITGEEMHRQLNSRGSESWCTNTSDVTITPVSAAVFRNWNSKLAKSVLTYGPPGDTTTSVMVSHKLADALELQKRFAAMFPEATMATPPMDDPVILELFQRRDDQRGTGVVPATHPAASGPEATLPTGSAPWALASCSDPRGEDARDSTPVESAETVPANMLIRLPCTELSQVVPVLQSAGVMPLAGARRVFERGLQYDVPGARVSMQPERGSCLADVDDIERGLWVAFHVQSNLVSPESRSILLAVLGHWSTASLVWSDFTVVHTSASTKGVAARVSAVLKDRVVSFKRSDGTMAWSNEAVEGANFAVDVTVRRNWNRQEAKPELEGVVAGAVITTVAVSHKLIDTKEVWHRFQHAFPDATMAVPPLYDPRVARLFRTRRPRTKQGSRI